MRIYRIPKRTPYIIAILCAAIVSLGAVSALAQNIYLNDVDISNAKLSNWTLNNVDEVEFDEDGNIHIKAPGYNVKVVGSGSSSATPDTSAASAPKKSSVKKEDLSAPVTIHYQADVSLSHRYMLTLANPNRKSVPYDVDVLINGKHAATYKYTRGNASIDVSDFIERGENTVTFIARRVAGEAPSEGNLMKVLLGVGSYDGKVAKYEHILVGMDYKSTDDRSSIRNSQKFDVR